MKQSFLGTITLVLSLSVVILCGEVAIRLYHSLLAKSYIFHYIRLDDTLGWKPTEHLRFRGDTKDAAGHHYILDIHTNQDGFRIFGNPQEHKKKKVFFIGDSFTHAIEVSNNKTYYSLLQDMLPIEVFAFGGSGYGTLQEFMVLDTWVDTIKPDLVVLQYSANDFINNHYELEQRSYFNNNSMQRPYWTTNNTIIYAIPKPWPRVYQFSNRHSHLVHFLLRRFDVLRASWTTQAEDLISKEGTMFRPFHESAAITETILKHLQARLPSATAVTVFAVDAIQPYYDAFTRILHHSHIDFMDGVPQAIHDAEQHGVIVRAADKAHWNETGHRIAAEVLRRHMSQKIPGKHLQ